MPPQQQGMPQQQGLSPELARKIITLEKEVAANPQSAVSWANLGHVYFDTGKVQKAITAYNKSLEIAPVNPDVWTDLVWEEQAQSRQHARSTLDFGFFIAPPNI